MPRASDDPTITGNHAPLHTRKLTWLELEVSDKEVRKIHKHLKRVKGFEILTQSQIRPFMKAAGERYVDRIKFLNDIHRPERKKTIFDRFDPMYGFSTCFPGASLNLQIDYQLMVNGIIECLSGRKIGDIIGYDDGSENVKDSIGFDRNLREQRRSEDQATASRAIA